MAENSFGVFFKAFAESFAAFYMASLQRKWQVADRKAAEMHNLAMKAQEQRFSTQERQSLLMMQGLMDQGEFLSAYGLMRATAQGSGDAALEGRLAAADKRMKGIMDSELRRGASLDRVELRQSPRQLGDLVIMQIEAEMYSDPHFFKQVSVEGAVDDKGNPLTRPVPLTPDSERQARQAYAEQLGRLLDEVVLNGNEAMTPSAQDSIMQRFLFQTQAPPAPAAAEGEGDRGGFRPFKWFGDTWSDATDGMTWPWQREYWEDPLEAATGGRLSTPPEAPPPAAPPKPPYTGPGRIGRPYTPAGAATDLPFNESDYEFEFESAGSDAGRIGRTEAGAGTPKLRYSEVTRRTPGQPMLGQRLEEEWSLGPTAGVAGRTPAAPETSQQTDRRVFPRFTAPVRDPVADLVSAAGAAQPFAPAAAARQADRAARGARARPARPLPIPGVARGVTGDDARYVPRTEPGAADPTMRTTAGGETEGLQGVLLGSGRGEGVRTGRRVEPGRGPVNLQQVLARLDERASPAARAEFTLHGRRPDAAVQAPIPEPDVLPAPGVERALPQPQEAPLARPRGSPVVPAPPALGYGRPGGNESPVSRGAEPGRAAAVLRPPGSESPVSRGVEPGRGPANLQEVLARLDERPLPAARGEFTLRGRGPDAVVQAPLPEPDVLPAPGVERALPQPQEAPLARPRGSPVVPAPPAVGYGRPGGNESPVARGVQPGRAAAVLRPQGSESPVARGVEPGKVRNLVQEASRRATAPATSAPGQEPAPAPAGQPAQPAAAPPPDPLAAIFGPLPGTAAAAQPRPAAPGAGSLPQVDEAARVESREALAQRPAARRRGPLRQPSVEQLQRERPQLAIYRPPPAAAPAGSGRSADDRAQQGVAAMLEAQRRGRAPAVTDPRDLVPATPAAVTAPRDLPGAGASRLAPRDAPAPAATARTAPREAPVGTTTALAPRDAGEPGLQALLNRAAQVRPQVQTASRLPGGLPMAPPPTPPEGDEDEEGVAALLNPWLAGRRLIRGVEAAVTPDRPQLAETPAAETGVRFDQAAGWQQGEIKVKHTIKSGETLGAIAQQYGTTVAALAAANGIADPDRIRAGVTISIPVERAADPVSVRRTEGAAAEQPWLGNPNEPRGIRNNNPGNIRHGPSQWAGMSEQQPDREFLRFNTVEDGIQALTELADTYYTRHGLHTVDGFISRWAPPEDNNDTAAYVAAVERAIGSKTWSIHDRASTLALIKAIIKHENGKQPYDDRTLLRGMEQARGGRLFPAQGVPDTLAAGGTRRAG